jgi:hypothetical protein
MANFRVTLSDHTQGSTDQLRQLISRHLQDFFNEVFAGTSDGATVTWGTAAASDALVIHFVEDVASSYISQRMPGSAHRPDGGGFTREQRGVTGSEFYKLVLTGGTPSRYNATGYAKIAFH